MINLIKIPIILLIKFEIVSTFRMSLKIANFIR